MILHDSTLDPYARRLLHDVDSYLHRRVHEESCQQLMLMLHTMSERLQSRYTLPP